MSVEFIQTFACMAEARAHFYRQGYQDLGGSCAPGRYVLALPGADQRLAPLVELLQTGFLTVEANFLSG